MMLPALTVLVVLGMLAGPASSQQSPPQFFELNVFGVELINEVILPVLDLGSCTLPCFLPRIIMQDYADFEQCLAVGEQDFTQELVQAGLTFVGLNYTDLRIVFSLFVARPNEAEPRICRILDNAANCFLNAIERSCGAGNRYKHEAIYRRLSSLLDCQPQQPEAFRCFIQPLVGFIEGFVGGQPGWDDLNEGGTQWPAFGNCLTLAGFFTNPIFQAFLAGTVAPEDFTTAAICMFEAAGNCINLVIPSDAACQGAMTFVDETIASLSSLLDCNATGMMLPLPSVTGSTMTDLQCIRVGLDSVLRIPNMAMFQSMDGILGMAIELGILSMTESVVPKQVVNDVVRKFDRYLDRNGEPEDDEEIRDMADSTCESVNGLYRTITRALESYPYVDCSGFQGSVEYLIGPTGNFWNNDCDCDPELFPFDESLGRCQDQGYPRELTRSEQVDCDVSDGLTRNEIIITVVVSILGFLLLVVLICWILCCCCGCGGGGCCGMGGEMGGCWGGDMMGGRVGPMAARGSRPKEIVVVGRRY